MFDVRDRNGRPMAALTEGSGGGRLPWAEEVLAAPAELEDKRAASEWGVCVGGGRTAKGQRLVGKCRCCCT